MHKSIIALWLLLAVAACGLPPGAVNDPRNPITMSRMYAAESNYKVANDGAEIYLSLRQCRKSEAANSFANGCRRYSYSVAIKAAEKKVNTAFVLARKCIRDTSTNTDCVALVEAAVATYSAQVLAAGR